MVVAAMVFRAGISLWPFEFPFWLWTVPIIVLQRQERGSDLVCFLCYCMSKCYKDRRGCPPRGRMCRRKKYCPWAWAEIILRGWVWVGCWVTWTVGWRTVLDISGRLRWPRSSLGEALSQVLSSVQVISRGWAVPGHFQERSHPESSPRELPQVISRGGATQGNFPRGRRAITFSLTHLSKTTTTIHISPNIPSQTFPPPPPSCPLTHDLHSCLTCCHTLFSPTVGAGGGDGNQEGEVRRDDGGRGGRWRERKKVIGWQGGRDVRRTRKEMKNEKAGRVWVGWKGEG